MWSSSGWSGIATWVRLRVHHLCYRQIQSSSKIWWSRLSRRIDMYEVSSAQWGTLPFQRPIWKGTIILRWGVCQAVRTIIDCSIKAITHKMNDFQVLFGMMSIVLKLMWAIALERDRVFEPAGLKLGTFDYCPFESAMTTNKDAFCTFCATLLEFQGALNLFYSSSYGASACFWTCHLRLCQQMPRRNYQSVTESSLSLLALAWALPQFFMFHIEIRMQQ